MLVGTGALITAKFYATLWIIGECFSADSFGIRQRRRTVNVQWNSSGPSLSLHDVRCGISTDG